MKLTVPFDLNGHIHVKSVLLPDVVCGSVINHVAIAHGLLNTHENVKFKVYNS